MEYLEKCRLNDRICLEGDLSCVKYISASTDNQVDIGVRNVLSGGDYHETMALGVENEASNGGLAVGFWSKANGEDSVAIGCGAYAQSSGYANNVAIGRHASVSGAGSVQILKASPTEADREAGRSYNTLSSIYTLRFRDTVVVDRNGKIPASSIDSSLSAAIVEAVLARLGQRL